MHPTNDVISRAWLMWDNANLYFAASGTDHDLLASLMGRDEKIWKEDAFELFVRPSLKSIAYWEYEWSPANQLLDIAWLKAPEKDFERNKAWNGKGVSAVVYKGTLNDQSDTDEGWTLEVRIPFSDFAAIAPEAPKAGDVWLGMVRHYSKWLPEGGGKKKVRTLMSNPGMLAEDVDDYLKFHFVN